MTEVDVVEEGDKRSLKRMVAQSRAQTSAQVIQETQSPVRQGIAASQIPCPR